MRIDWKYLLIAGLIAGWVHDVRVYHRNQSRYNRHLAIAKEEFDRAAALANLYADQLNRNHVPIDDFTRIAMLDLYPN